MFLSNRNQSTDWSTDQFSIWEGHWFLKVNISLSCFPVKQHLSLLWRRSYHIETSSLICRAYQLIGFHKRGTSLMKELILVSKLKEIHLQILPSNWSKEVNFRLSQRPAAFQVITWQIIWVFDHFVRLALKGLKIQSDLHHEYQRKMIPPKVFHDKHFKNQL